MPSKPQQDVASLRRELSTVKAELYSLQTARSVRMAQFLKQLVKSRRPGELVAHIKTAPKLLKRADPPKITDIDAYGFPNSVQSPAPLFVYANLNVALIGEAGKSIFSQTTNCVSFGGSEFKVLARFDSIQIIAIDFHAYDESIHDDIVEYVSASALAKVLVLADLTHHNVESIKSKMGGIAYQVVDLSDTSLLHIDIYRIGSHQIAADNLSIRETTNTLPEIPDINSQEILLIDHASLGSEHSTYQQLLSLIAGGVPIVFKDSLPNFLEGSPLLTARSEQDYAHLLTEPYAADRYRATTKRFAIATYSSLAPVNYILRTYLPHISLQNPLAPNISVLLPTRRPEFISNALTQLENQTVKPHEIILMLHGLSKKDYEKAQQRAESSSLTVKISRHDKDQLFGQVLNDGLASVTGEFVTKVDDDDHYGENHLLDLCVARLHSQADIVGKWNNWVHITASDEVISWAPEKENGYYGHLPGGTIMAKTELIKNLGFGFVRHGIDSELYERAKRRGVTMYSTHRYNYVRVRHDDHTYTAKSSDFMSRAHPVKFKELDLQKLFC